MHQEPPDLDNVKLSLTTYNWHEFQGIVPLSLNICANYGRQMYAKDRQFLCQFKADIKEVMVAMIRHEDHRLSTSILLKLHELVQDVLGIGQALDLEGKSKHKLAFLVEVPDVLLAVAEIGLEREDPVKDCAEETWMFFLKNSTFLGPVWYERFRLNVLLPALPVLTAFMHRTKYLGRHLTGLLSATQSPLAFDELVLLEANLRLLFHCEEEVRFSAGNNLKCLLSKEENSAVTLPRFNDIISEDFSVLFYGKSRSVFTRNVPPNPGTFEALQSVISNLRGIRDPLTPEDFIVIVRTNLCQLDVLLENVQLCQVFGRDLDWFWGLWHQTLSETDFLRFAHQSLIPLFVQITLKWLLMDPRLPDETKQRLLYLLLRSALLMEDETDAAVCTYLTLQFTDKTLKIKPVYQAYFSVAMDNVSVETPSLCSLPLDPDLGPVLKCFWNQSTHEQDPKAAPKLAFNEVETAVFRASHPQCLFKHVFRCLRNAEHHKHFEAHLNLMTVAVKAGNGFNTAEDLELTFLRFFAKKPTSYRDEKLFLSLLGALTVAVEESHYQCDPLNAFIQETVLTSANLIGFLVGETDYSGKSEIHRTRAKLVSGRFMRALLKGPYSFQDLMKRLSVKELKEEHVAVCRNVATDAFLTQMVQDFEEKKLQGLAAFKQTLAVLQERRVDRPLMDLIQRKTWKSRDVGARILGLQLVLENVECLSVEWSDVLSVALDVLECSHVRYLAFQLMSHLVSRQNDDEVRWTGPTFVENVSGIEIDGEGALAHLFQRLHVATEMSHWLSPFSTAAVSSEDHTLASESTTAGVVPSGQLLAATFHFLSCLLQLENERNAATDDALNPKDSLDILPGLDEALVPAVVRSVPNFQSLENSPHFQDLILNLLTFFRQLLVRKRLKGSGEWDVPQDALVVMSYQLFKDQQRGHLTALFAESAEFLLTLNDMKRGKEIAHMLDYQLDQDDVDASLCFCAVVQDCPPLSVKRVCLKVIKIHLNQPTFKTTQALCHLFKLCSENSIQMVTENGPLVQKFVQETVLETDALINKIQTVKKSKLTLESLAQNLGLLTNFCYNNLEAKEALNLCHVLGVVQPLFVHLLRPGVVFQVYPSDLCKVALDFATTFTANSNTVKSSLSKSCPGQDALLQVFVDVCTGSAVHAKVNRLFFEQFVYPTCFRLVLSCLTSHACRAFVLRKNLKMLQQTVDVLEAQTQPKKMVLHLDLLLSFTAFPEGQLWVGKHKELVDILTRMASDFDSHGTLGLASLAVVHNLSFHPVCRTRLLLSPTLMSGLKRWLVVDAQGRNKVRNLALRMVWNLAANSHKGKSALIGANVNQVIHESMEVFDDELISSVANILKAK